MRTIKGIVFGVFCLVVLVSVANARPLNRGDIVGDVEFCLLIGRTSGQTMGARQGGVSMDKVLDIFRKKNIKPAVLHSIMELIIRRAWDEPIKSTCFRQGHLAV